MKISSNLISLINKPIRIVPLMSVNKKIKLDNMVKICTHSGSFHADESLAVYLLKLLPKYSQAELVRSRNPED